jgi:hypothetical protein
VEHRVLRSATHLDQALGGRTVDVVGPGWRVLLVDRGGHREVGAEGRESGVIARLGDRIDSVITMP